MAPTTLLDLPNEMLIAIFTTIADDASTADALSASCSTLRQLWTSSAELIFYRSIPCYTGARDVALAQDYLETRGITLDQNYQETSSFITLKATPEYSHSIAHQPLVPKGSSAAPLASLPVPNVLIPCQGVESKHISLMQKLAQKAQRLCDLVEKHLVSIKLGCLNATCRARPPTLVAYERTRIIHAYYLIRLYLLLQSWSAPDHQILTARHSLTNHLETMHLRERGLLHEVLKFATKQEAFKDLFVAKDPDAASDDPYNTEFATRNCYALRKIYRDIERKVEYPDDDECKNCEFLTFIFGPEGSIPGEENWGHEKLTSSLLFRKPQKPQSVRGDCPEVTDVPMTMTL